MVAHHDERAEPPVRFLARLEQTVSNASRVASSRKIWLRSYLDSARDYTRWETPASARAPFRDAGWPDVPRNVKS